MKIIMQIDVNQICIDSELYEKLEHQARQKGLATDKYVQQIIKKTLAKEAAARLIEDELYHWKVEK